MAETVMPRCVRTLKSLLDFIEVDDFLCAHFDEVLNTFVERIGKIRDQGVLAAVFGCGKVGGDSDVCPALGAAGEKTIAHIFKCPTVVAGRESLLADEPVVRNAIEGVSFCGLLFGGCCGAGDSGVKSG